MGDRGKKARFTRQSGVDILPTHCQALGMAKTEPTKPRKLNPALSKPVQPDEALSVIVGSTPLSRGELTKKLWDYIKANGLQDQTKKTLINADAALKVVFNGKAQVSMFEMTKLVSGHVKA